MRMNDKNDEVRIESAKALCQFFSQVPGTVSQAEFANTVKLLIIHLDDPALPVQQAVKQALVVAIKCNPGYLQLIRGMLYDALKLHTRKEPLIELLQVS